MKGVIMCFAICFCSVQAYYSRMQTSAGRQYRTNNFMNNRYSNFNNNNINGYQQQTTTRSNMGYLPFLLGDEGRQLASYSMMMNSNGNNVMLPYFINGGETSSMLPMMAFMNKGGRRVNPFVMSMLMESEL